MDQLSNDIQYFDIKTINHVDREFGGLDFFELCMYPIYCRIKEQRSNSFIERYPAVSNAKILEWNFAHISGSEELIIHGDQVDEKGDLVFESFIKEFFKKSFSIISMKKINNTYYWGNEYEKSTLKREDVTIPSGIVEMNSYLSKKYNIPYKVLDTVVFFTYCKLLNDYVNYKFLFVRSNIKEISIFGALWNKGAIIAAKERGILVKEIQYSYCNTDHLGFYYNNRVLFAPDIFYYWSSNINKKKLYGGAEIRMIKLEESIYKQKYTFKKQKYDYLIISSRSITKETNQLVQILLKQGISVHVKRHPKEKYTMSEGNILNFNPYEYNVIVGFESSLYYTLKIEGFNTKNIFAVLNAELIKTSLYFKILDLIDGAVSGNRVYKISSKELILYGENNENVYEIAKNEKKLVKSEKKMSSVNIKILHSNAMYIIHKNNIIYIPKKRKINIFVTYKKDKVILNSDSTFSVVLVGRKQRCKYSEKNRQIILLNSTNELYYDVICSGKNVSGIEIHCKNNLFKYKILKKQNKHILRIISVKRILKHYFAAIKERRIRD